MEKLLSEKNIYSSKNDIYHQIIIMIIVINLMSSPFWGNWLKHSILKLKVNHLYTYPFKYTKKYPLNLTNLFLEDNNY
jgi:hypothetical protein